MSFEQLNSLDSLLAQIDKLQDQVNTLKAAQPDAYVHVMENWAVESTYNSNNIEGSTLSLGDTALVYEGCSVDAPNDDIKQAEGGFVALKFYPFVDANGRTGRLMSNFLLMSAGYEPVNIQVESRARYIAGINPTRKLPDTREGSLSALCAPRLSDEV